MPNERNKARERNKKAMNILRFLLAMTVILVNIAILILIIKLVFNRLGDFGQF